MGELHASAMAAGQLLSHSKLGISSGKRAGRYVKMER